MWSEDSLMGVYRFVGKIYNLFKKTYKIEADENDLRAMHKCILEVTERIDQMRFNTAVSSLMTYVNYLSGKEKIAYELYANLIKMLSPFTPHLAEEMWARLGNTSLVVKEEWPDGNPELAQDNKVTIAVQVCGKVRGTIEVVKDTPKEDVEKEALALENVKKQIEGKEIRKIIVVPNKIVNIVV
jgi:leucyl-tRNA synthetase